MSATLAPFGLKPLRSLYGEVPTECVPNGFASGSTSAMYQGQPVKIDTSGYVVPVSATSDDFVGAFQGVKYTDSTGKRVIGNMLPLNTVATEIEVYITRDPAQEYEIQADGSVAQTAVGDQLNFTNLTDYGAATGISHCTAGYAPVTASSQGQLRVLGKSMRVDNDWGDTYTIVRVKIARHQDVANKVAY